MDIRTVRKLEPGDPLRAVYHGETDEDERDISPQQDIVLFDAIIPKVRVRREGQHKDALDEMIFGHRPNGRRVWLNLVNAKKCPGYAPLYVAGPNSNRQIRIRCFMCGLTSFHPVDVENKWCGSCKTRIPETADTLRVQLKRGAPCGCVGLGGCKPMERSFTRKGRGE